MAGKFGALLIFAAAVLLFAEAAIWLMSLAIAPTQDISTSEWFSWSGLREAAEDYGTALFWVGSWSCFAMTLGVVLRSIPLVLAVGIGWFGPFEHITEGVFDFATKAYPGLLLERLAFGGTSEVSYSHALAVVACYVAAAGLISAVTFTRRDVTA